MASVATSTNFADVLDPRFNEITIGSYNERPSFLDQIFTMETSDRDTERVSAITPMGDAPDFDGNVEYDAPDLAYDVIATHKETAKGVQIQRKLMDDDQFDVIDDLFRELGESFSKRKEKDSARWLNQMFNNDIRYYNHSEGVSLCNNSHTTTRTGVSVASGFDNVVTTPLSGTALTAAIILFRDFRDLAGEPHDIDPDEIWYPNSLYASAEEIMRTRVGLDTAEGNVNIHAGKLELKRWIRMTDSNNWALTNSTLRKRSLRWYTRIAFETSKMEAFDQFLAKGRGYERYSYLYKFWQFILGAQVS